MSRSVSSSFFSPSTSTSTTAAPSSSSTGTTFQFTNIDEMFTCGVALLEWTYSGPEAPMSFTITNVNVAQQAPLSIPSAATSTTENGKATPSTAKRDIKISKRQYSGYGGAYLPQINEQLATQLDPLVGIWRWTSTNVPQGWYQMLVSVQGVLETSSSSFFVQNGTNVGCVLQFYPASSTSAVQVSATTKATTTSSRATTHTGTIVGGVIGGVAAVIGAIIIIAFARRRRRQDHVRRKTVDPSFSSNALIMRAGAEVTVNTTLTDDTPSSPPHHQSGPVGTMIVPLNPGPSSSGTLLPLHSAHVPVGLSGKELAQLRSRGAALHPEPTTASSPSNSEPTTTSPPIVVATVQGEVTPPEARITALQSEVENLQREVLRLQAQQVRAEGFGAPPSYGEARSS